MTNLRWNSRDLATLPDDNKQRYEVIDGELYVSKQPHYYHQLICSRLITFLNTWSIPTELGEATVAPGLIFADDDDVVPDVIWMSQECQATALQEDGKLHSAPELVVEVLSPGTTNEYRDRETKLKLYSRRGVLEYWVVSWMERHIEIYRRDETMLRLVSTLYETDLLQSPYLPGFTCQLSKLFANFK